jgi:hypothetical protein
MTPARSRLSAGTVVLDGHGLSGWCAADQRVTALIRDAVVAATALRATRPVIVLTPDAHGMGELCGKLVRIVVLQSPNADNPPATTASQTPVST